MGRCVHRNVVAPGRVGHVDGGALRKELCVKVAGDAAGARAREGLDAHNAALLERLAIIAVSKSERLVKEVRHACDRRIPVREEARGDKWSGGTGGIKGGGMQQQRQWQSYQSTAAAAGGK